MATNLPLGIWVRVDEVCNATLYAHGLYLPKRTPTKTNPSITSWISIPEHDRDPTYCRFCYGQANLTNESSLANNHDIFR